MRLLPSVLANLLLILAAFGLGGLLLPLLPQNFSKTDRVAASALGGFGLLGTLLFLVGIVHFSLAVVLAVLLPFLLLGLLSVRKAIQDLADHRPLDGIPFLAAAVISLVLIVTLVGGLAGPVGDIKMDAIAYHFLGPHVWALDGVIHPVPDECLTSFPANVETLFAALMMLGGTRAPELFALSALGLLLLVSFGLARRLGLDSRGAWWGIALIAAMPVVYRGSYGGFNDAILAGFCLLALRLGLDAAELKHYALAGIFGGLAMGTKYTAVPSFLIILACVLVSTLFSGVEKAGKPIVGLVLFASVASLIAAPWYVRNWSVLGSPIYPPPPVLLRFFQVKYMSPQAIDSLAALVRKEGLGMGHSLSSFLLLPFHLTFHPANFLNGPGGVGVALLALAPLGLLMQRRVFFVRMLVLFAFMQTVTWFLTEQDARFLIHIYVLIAIFAIWGWRYVVSRAPRFGPFLSGLAIACSILYGLVMIVTSRATDIHAALSTSYELARKYREVPFLESFAYLNESTSVKRVLIPEPRVPTFYLQKDYVKPIGRFGEQTLPDGVDLDKTLSELSVLGITHVLDVRLDGNGFRIDGRRPGLILVLDRENQRVYSFSPSP